MNKELQNVVAAN